MSELEDKIKTLLDSPEAITKIMSVAQTLSGNSKETAAEEERETEDGVALDKGYNEEAVLESLDPRVVSAAMEIMGEYRNTDDRRIRLLQALRSYFNDDDQVHITKAIQIVKLSKVAKKAFRSIREEDSFV